MPAPPFLHDEVLHDGDLDHVAGPLVGERIPLSDGASTDAHLSGPEDGAVVVLIPGLSQQRTHWPPELMATLHDAGYRTLAADNRDVGLGQVVDVPVDQLPRAADGWPVPPYDLARLAQDHLDVLSHLGIGRAHVLGVSMGGKIAQHAALVAPDRVASLISVMSTTGARDVGRPSERAKPVLTTLPPVDDLDAHVDHQLDLQARIASPGFAEPERAAARARVAWARGLHAWGSARQLLAIRADGDRTARLRGLAVPTLVLHGEADPLIDVSGGRATAEAIPGARLVTLPGWGHDLPVAFLDRLAPLVLDHLAAHPAV